MNCEAIKEYLIDYLDGNLSEEEKIKVSKHLEECEECRQELYEVEKMISEIEQSREDIVIPKDFMLNVKNKVDSTKNGGRKLRKSLRTMLIAAAILTMSVATVFAAKEPIMNLIKLINPDSRMNKLIDRGYGNKLNISRTDKNIKITVTDVVADDMQTLISYKIEDIKEGKEYRIKYNDGIDIKENWVKQLEGTNIKMYTAVFNSGGTGTLTLYPIDTDDKTINLTFKKLITKSGDSEEVVEGNWSFEIPITKHEGKSYDINASIKVENYTIEFNKITISPTLTRLGFNCRNGGKKNERVLGLEDVRIFVKGKEYKPYNFGHGDWNAYSAVGYGNNEMTFDSMYFDNPKEIEIRVTRISTEISESKPVELFVKLDEDKPQEFEYLGTKLLVNNLKVGEDITFEFNQPEYSDKFEMLSTEFWPADDHSAEKSFSSGGGSNEVYYIDKYNKKHEYLNALSDWDKIRINDPVLYIANTKYKLEPSKGLDIKKEKTFRVLINGYTKTRFVNEAVKVKLK
ncbi:DUF4179 domain-containing protein [Clostridium swellfunianum]|uniref:DUF4179 domain-containing protein n=1 Tax=Clostridium swellfunianum TaxID=1367462 RepID=UPI002030E378|nr:DUF4179 domain-containing protein [Clostridium swellfunianum]MCM0647128.1 DUF4179 domain-containing protein [Clostridium swellfunianum]